MPKASVEDEIDVMARTIFGEARGESLDGQIAVAWVIRNRADIGGWWGSTIKAVCLKRKQFSCWNANDPNRKRLLAATLADARFRRAYGIAALVYNRDLPDPTSGATHYHRPEIDPTWNDNMIRLAEIGDHVFFKELT